MENGQSKSGLIVPPPPIIEEQRLICHRIYAPIVIPEPLKTDPRQATVTPRFGSFPCAKENCTLWNTDAKECFDVTQAKSLAILAKHSVEKIEAGQ